MATSTGQAAFRIHIVYRLFFLVIEPLSTLVGAFYIHFCQRDYLKLLHAASAPDHQVPLSTSVAMSQLANMFIFFAISEALVLRSTADLRVWNTVILVLLIADLGHLLSMSELGLQIYWDARNWNVSDWRNVPGVYVGATLRICFLSGLGLGPSRVLNKKN